MAEMEPTILFAVRHGETEWNLTGKQQGHLDSPLTETGVAQANAAAEGLVGRGIEVMYSSDLGRAMRTAETIAVRLGLPVHSDERLRERHLGSMQGMTKAEFQRECPEEYAAFDSGDPEYQFPDGESARERYERCVLGTAELASRHPGQTILVVAHGGVVSSFFYRAMGTPLSEPRRFSLFNAAINSFTIAGDAWRLDTWGDIAHLGGMTTLDDN